MLLLESSKHLSQFHTFFMTDFISKRFHLKTLYILNFIVLMYIKKEGFESMEL